MAYMVRPGGCKQNAVGCEQKGPPSTNKYHGLGCNFFNTVWVRVMCSSGLSSARLKNCLCSLANYPVQSPKHVRSDGGAPYLMADTHVAAEENAEMHKWRLSEAVCPKQAKRSKSGGIMLQVRCTNGGVETACSDDVVENRVADDTESVNLGEVLEPIVEMYGECTQHRPLSRRETSKGKEQGLHLDSACREPLTQTCTTSGLTNRVKSLAQPELVSLGGTSKLHTGCEMALGSSWNDIEFACERNVREKRAASGRAGDVNELVADDNDSIADIPGIGLEKAALARERVESEKTGSAHDNGIRVCTQLESDASGVVRLRHSGRPAPVLASGASGVSLRRSGLNRSTVIPGLGGGGGQAVSDKSSFSQLLKRMRDCDRAPAVEIKRGRQANWPLMHLGSSRRAQSSGEVAGASSERTGIQRALNSSSESLVGSGARAVLACRVRAELRVQPCESTE